MKIGIDKIAIISVTLMSLLILFLSVIILGGAFLTLYNTNNIVLNDLNDTRCLMEEFSLHTYGDKTKIADRIIVKLDKFLIKYEKGIRGILDANTISFLFQIFSIALISASAYIVTYSLKTTRDITKQINEMKVKIEEIKTTFKTITPYLDGSMASFSIGSYPGWAPENTPPVGTSKYPTYLSFSSLKKGLKIPHVWALKSKRATEQTE